MKKILLVLLSLLSLTCFLTACNENKNDACAHSYGEWDIHYLPIYYHKEHLFTCQELSQKRKDGVGFFDTT